VYATNLLYPTSRCGFYNITVANFQIDPKSYKKYFFPNNYNNQLKLFFYGVPYINVQGGPDTPIDFVLGNPGLGSHVGCLPSPRSSCSLVRKSETSETRFKALQAVHLS